MKEPDGLDGVLESTGVPLGVFADATFATRHVQLGPRQILVLSTDGGTEALDPAGTEFGRRGVTEYVTAHANETAGEIAVGLYGAVQSFSAGEPQHDDVTFVIVKMAGQPSVVDQGTGSRVGTSGCLRNGRPGRRQRDLIVKTQHLPGT